MAIGVGDRGVVAAIAKLRGIEVAAVHARLGETCAPSTGTLLSSTTVPAIAAVRSSRSTTLVAEPLVASSCTAVAEPSSCDAVAISSLRGRPLIANSPLVSVYA